MTSRIIPQTLRGQFALALSVLAALVVTAGVIAIHALRTSNSAIHDLAQERMVRMQDAQALLERTLLIERETARLLTVPTSDELMSTYAGLDRHLQELETLVGKLAGLGQNADVLDMHQASALFRNTADIVVRLRKDELVAEIALALALNERTGQLQARPAQSSFELMALLHGLRNADRAEQVRQLRAEFLGKAETAEWLPPGLRSDRIAMLAQGSDALDPNAGDPFSIRLSLIDGKATLKRFHAGLQQQAGALVAAGQEQSNYFTRDYRAALDRVAESATRWQRWVAVMLAGSLLLAWLVAHVFVGRHVLKRLDEVSRRLRLGEVDDAASKPDLRQDEIAAMARAVAQFLQDRRQLQKRTDELAAMKERLAEQNTQLQLEAATRAKVEMELRESLRELGQAQSQLLHSEKMASIGVLAAGIAHEINNPVGFVNSNLGSLQSYARDILRLLDTYEEAEPSMTVAAQQAVARVKQEIDADYLREDIGNLLAESLDGLQRVRRIVQDLKDFSHVDESERQFADLEKGLDSTLNVVWNELKHKAQVVKEYAHIPQIECFPSQLNQVFMNLLINAAHAIDGFGRVVLRTGRDEEQVWVEVEDNGKGIAPEHLDRIFEPFFTTKPVGQGTGLGLSLSYGIVQKHAGRIEVRSELGKGTAFRVVLPLAAKLETV